MSIFACLIHLDSHRLTFNSIDTIFFMAFLLQQWCFSIFISLIHIDTLYLQKHRHISLWPFSAATIMASHHILYVLDSHRYPLPSTTSIQSRYGLSMLLSIMVMVFYKIHNIHLVTIFMLDSHRYPLPSTASIQSRYGRFLPLYIKVVLSHSVDWHRQFCTHMLVSCNGVQQHLSFYAAVDSRRYLYLQQHHYNLEKSLSPQGNNGVQRFSRFSHRYLILNNIDTIVHGLPTCFVNGVCPYLSFLPLDSHRYLATLPTTSIQFSV